MNPARLALLHCLREWSRHPVATALNLTGIAAGVALFVAIKTANHSALRSFQASVDLVAGRANMQIVSQAGTRMDEESALKVVWNERGISHSTPVLEQLVMLPDFPGEYLRLVGVDLFSSESFRTWRIRPAEGVDADVENFLTTPGSVAIQSTLARRLGIAPGSKLRWRALGREGELRVLFTLEYDQDAVGADEHFAMMDLAGVQEVLGMVGFIDRIDAILSEDFSEEDVLRRLNEKLPEGLAAQRPDRRNRQVELMIGAFQLNLTALSLIALMVGAFLVYNTMANSVVRRRAEIGTLRAIGFTRGQVRGVILLEAATLGLVGSVLGLPLGRLLAGALVGAVSQTISSLYILLSIREVFVDGWVLLSGLVLGMTTALAAAWLPAREASLVTPREALWPGTLMDKASLDVYRWLLLGTALLLGALALSFLSLRPGPAWLSFAAAGLTLLGFAMTAPWVGQGLSTFLEHVVKRRINTLSTSRTQGRLLIWLLSARFFHSGLHRNSVAVAALASTVAMIVGIGVMVHSFRVTVDTWISGSVRADIFVSPASNLVSPGAEFLSDDVIRSIERLNLFEAVDRYREIRLEYEGRPTKLAAVDFSVMGRLSPLPVRSANAREIIRQAAASGEILVSEPFSTRFGTKVGDMIHLQTPQGLRSFRVAGIFTDYTTDKGLILIDWPVFAELWSQERPQSLALYLRDGVNLNQALSVVREALAGPEGYLIYTNQLLRTEVLRIFDQTFSVTSVLQTIAFLIAGVGIFLTATLLGMERRRELAVLRAVGYGRLAVLDILTREAVLIGVCGGLIGLSCGLCLAVLLMHVINVAYFGWTISWATPWQLVLGVTPLAIFSSWFAALYPSVRATAEHPASCLRAE